MLELKSLSVQCLGMSVPSLCASEAMLELCEAMLVLRGYVGAQVNVCTMFANVCAKFARCLHNVCAVTAQGLYSICTMSVQCLYSVSKMSVQCLYRVGTVFAQCQHSVS